MKTVSKSSKTRHARRARAVRIAWGDTVKQEVFDHVGDSRNAPAIARLALQRLLDEFPDVDAIGEEDVEDAVASACAERAGTPVLGTWDDFELMHPDWDLGGGRDALFFVAEPAIRPIRR